MTSLASDILLVFYCSYNNNNSATMFGMGDDMMMAGDMDMAMGADMMGVGAMDM